MVALNSLYQSTHNYETGARVEVALNAQHPSKFDGLHATAFCGIVELSGVVASHDDKAQAIRVARRVAGVSTVVESVRVDGAHDHSRSLKPKIPRRPLMPSPVASGDRFKNSD